jgi:hypothetical protein
MSLSRWQKLAAHKTEKTVLFVRVGVGIAWVVTSHPSKGVLVADLPASLHEAKRYDIGLPPVLGRIITRMGHDPTAADR